MFFGLKRLRYEFACLMFWSLQEKEAPIEASLRSYRSDD
jgi:hypothetical protein